MRSASPRDCLGARLPEKTRGLAIAFQTGRGSLPQQQSWAKERPAQEQARQQQVECSSWAA